MMKPTTIPNLYIKGRYLYTKTNQNESIYGERILLEDGHYYREFAPLKSKLASSIYMGFKPEIRVNDHILYLGASTGTTASHISDIVNEGKIYAVEFSPISMIKLMELSNKRENIMAIMLDANRPETYSPFIDHVDLVYQDVAQPNQIDIFLRNVDYYNSKRGILMLKTYSIRSEVETKNEIKRLNKIFDFVDYLNIERYHKGHFAIYVKV